MLQLSRGRAMEVIVASLEELGYKWAYRVTNTLAFGLPQRRERVFLLASLDEDPRDVLFADDAGEPEPPKHTWRNACGFYWTEGIRGLGWAVNAIPTLKGGSTVGIPSPPAIVMPTGAVVTPDIRDAERLQGFESDWTLPCASVGRNSHRWKLVGNAVTVDVAQWLGERLVLPDEAGREVSSRPLTQGTPWPRAAYNVGQGRFAADVSSWPVHIRGEALHRFLQFPRKPLSVKATEGFLSRAETSSLRFPDGFIEKLCVHLDGVRQREALLRAARERDASAPQL